MCNMDNSTPKSSESAPRELYQRKKSTDVSSNNVHNFNSIYVADQHSEQYLSWQIPPHCAHLSSIAKYCSEFHPRTFSFNFPQVYSQETHEMYYSSAIMPPTLMWPYWYHFQPAYYEDVTQNSFLPFSHVTCHGEIDNLHVGDLQCTYSSPVVDSSSRKALKFKTKCSKLQEVSESSQRHSVTGGKVASSRILSSLSLRMELIMRGADTRSSLMLRNIPSRYKQDKLLAELTEEGFGSNMIDFLYLPINPKNNRNRGYAFVNFVDYDNIVLFYTHFGGRPWKLFNDDTKKSCKVSYSVIQGKAAMLKIFEHSLCFEQKEMYHPVTFVSDGPNKGDIEVIFTS